MQADEVRAQVLEDVLPDAEERAANQEMFDRIRDFIADEFGREARLMGSTAKGTFMAGDKDLDIFVFFDESVSEEELEERGLEIGEAVFNEFDGDCSVEFAEHPYTKGDIDGYEVEIVPAYDVASGEEIRSAVDRTPFHADWVNEHLSDAEKQEVVLLKAFLRGQDLYGSTLRVEGFSGYLCELLVAVYGSLDAVLEAAVDWAEQEVIDPAGHHDGVFHHDSGNRGSSTRSSGTGALPNFLRDKFENDALIVIDPVDPERNVAAVLSDDNYARFLYSAWRYRESPGTDFFATTESPVDAERLEQAIADRGDFVVVSFPRPDDMVDDILYPQLRRLMRRLTGLLEDNEFRLFESGFHVGGDRVRLVFDLYSNALPGMQKHMGPKVFHNDTHIRQFSEKYDAVWVEDGRLTTIIDRDHTTADGLLDDFLQGDLQGKGVPQQLVDAVGQRKIVGLDPSGNVDWQRFLRDTLKLVEQR